MGRAFFFQSIFGSLIILVTYFVTEPEANINWVYGFGRFDSPKILTPPLYIAGLIIGHVLLIYVPTHLILKRLFPTPVPKLNSAAI